MTRHGEKIPDVTPTRVKAALPEASSPKAVKRLVAAREYLAGHSPADIEAKYGFPEQTVYEWLDRLERRGLADGLDDDEPPGRPPRLGDDRLERLKAALQSPPVQAGYEEPRWNARLVQNYVRTEFGVDFSKRHARRLLHRFQRSALEVEPS